MCFADLVSDILNGNHEYFPYFSLIFPRKSKPKFFWPGSGSSKELPQHQLRLRPVFQVIKDSVTACAVKFVQHAHSTYNYRGFKRLITVLHALHDIASVQYYCMTFYYQKLSPRKEIVFRIIREQGNPVY
jgi:hypothetical protein